MKTILEVGKGERVVKHGRDKYTFGNTHGAVTIDTALGKAIESLVAERDAAVDKLQRLERAKEQ